MNLFNKHSTYTDPPDGKDYQAWMDRLHPKMAIVADIGSLGSTLFSVLMISIIQTTLFSIVACRWLRFYIQRCKEEEKDEHHDVHSCAGVDFWRIVDVH